MTARIVLLFCCTALTGSASPSDESASEVRRTIVVELFTSQGCSSCPPADRLLSRLGAEFEVIPLSFHVDYWNRLGWSDPFSSPDWSRRQSQYARVFGTGRVYTPMMVVDGKLDLVGSNETRVRDAIAERRQFAYQADVTVDAALRDEAIVAHVEIRQRKKLPRDLGVVFLTYEKGLVTHVESGENARRTLRNDFVVRTSASKPLTDPVHQSAALAFTEILPIDPAWNRSQLGVAVLLQSPSSQRIYGADAADLR